MDIRGGAVGDWLVIGWFTPDYRPLAEKFAANLTEHGAPYHLFARGKSANWSTLQKPSVVLGAMDAYPDKTLILMDVDCLVRGDISPAAGIKEDVGITILARNMRRHGRKWYYGIAMECSSRVVVFRPTPNARAFAAKWAQEIEQRAIMSHDEHSMVWAFVSCPNVTFSYIDQLYSGRDLNNTPDAVIGHISAHGEQKKRYMSWPKKVLGVIKVVERPFRTGRSSLRRQMQSG